MAERIFREHPSPLRDIVSAATGGRPFPTTENENGPKSGSFDVVAIKTGLAELEPSLNPHHFIPIYPSTSPLPRSAARRGAGLPAWPAGLPDNKGR